MPLTATERALSARQQGVLLALGSTAAYGTNIVSAQIAGQAGISGPWLVCYRVGLMLAATAALALLLRSSLTIPRGDRVAITVFGLASATVGLAYLSSVAFIPVTVAAVLFYTYPVLIVLAEPLLTRSGFRPDRLAVVLVAFIGVALVVGPDLHGLDPAGLALALIASVAATAQFFSAAAMRGTALLPKLLWSHIIILPVAVTILTVSGSPAGPRILALAPAAAAITIGCYVIGILLQIMALARIAPGAAGLAFCAEPVFAASIAAVVLGERLGPLQYGGGALVLAAILTNVILEQKRSLPATA